MRSKLHLLISTIVFMTVSALANAQDSPDTIPGNFDSKKFVSSVEDKAGQLAKKIEDKSLQVIARLEQTELKIYRKLLTTKDSVAAKIKLAEIEKKYASLKNGLKNNSFTGKITTYIPSIDSLTGSLKFLQMINGKGDITAALSKTMSLQNKFQQAQTVQNFIKERGNEIKSYLNSLGLTSKLKSLNKQVYYYSKQIQEYKNMLKNPAKIQQKTLELLAKTKLFKEFMRKNSMLAALFKIPGSAGEDDNQAGFTGLQTRAQINNLIQQKIESGGPNGLQQLRDNMSEAQEQLNQLKEKVLKNIPGGKGGSSDIMPEGFKPNEQKTKTFLQRIEVGTNIQTQKSTAFFPTTSDVALNLGYKLNDKSIIGVGASYKLGLGRGWNAVRLTSEGVGLRSYVDWKIKGNFWLSGGYEMNYKSSFQHFDQLKNMNGWMQSGLLGVSKSVPVKSKFFKKTKLQLLWDFLSQQQIPRTQAFIFRIGYDFK